MDLHGVEGAADDFFLPRHVSDEWYRLVSANRGADRPGNVVDGSTRSFKYFWSI